MTVDRKTMFAALAVALASACSSGGGTHTPSNEALTGTWQVAGPLLSTGDQALDYVVLDADGSGDLFSRSDATGVLGCSKLLFSVISSDAVTFEAGSYASGSLFHFERSGSTVTLIDATGATSTLTRADAVPASAQCAQAQISPPHALAGNIFAGYSGNLVFDGSKLWANTDSDVVVPIDPSTFETGTPLVLSSGYGGIKASQGSDFWAVCNCGGDTDVRRETQGSSKVDEIDTALFSANDQLGVDSAAFDGTSLWLLGYDYAQARPYLWHVDSDAEPDVLLSKNAVFGIQNIAFHQGALWGLAYGGNSRALVEIDTVTFKAVRTVALPAPTYWYALASVNGNLDVLGEDSGSDSSAPAFSIIEVGGL